MRLFLVQESGIADPSNKQYVDNQLAYDYLQALAALLPGNTAATIAAQTFLTPYIVSQLPDRMVLKLLNSNQEQPYLVWDNSCRQELIDTLDERRDFLVKNEYKLDVDRFGNPSEFRFSAHKNELIIGDIFVRVYNLQPTTVLRDPKQFCSNLIDFLGTSSQYVNTLMAMQIQQEQQKASVCPSTTRLSNSHFSSSPSRTRRNRRMQRSSKSKSTSLRPWKP